MTFDPPKEPFPPPEDLTPSPPLPTERTSPSREEDLGVDLFPILPTTPSGKRLYESFKRTIALHVANSEDKTTEEKVETLALELWRLTRESGI